VAIVLASTSKIRRALLHRAGVRAEIEVPGIDEQRFKMSHSSLSAAHLAQSLAEAKARSVSARHGNSLVVGADQILSIGGSVLDKPRSLDEARQQLQRLRGRTHTLITAANCAAGGLIVWSHVERAEMTVREFSDRFLDEYIEAVGGDVMTSVGGYKLEGLGSQLFSRVNGDYFAILGLPLLPLLAFLRSAGELTR
jgi:septum formation protein